MVATSQPLAAQAGLAILAAGGSACDAAVATAAMLNVVEPTGTGIGGDCFALLYAADSGRVLALNGSGRSPRALTADDLRQRGLTALPQRGALSVTVPGTVDAWSALLAGHGRMGLADVLAPAIATARAGYPVSERISAAWQASEALLGRHAAARRHLLPAGRAPHPGELVRLPALAAALALVAEGGPEAFYRGPIGADIVATCRAAGGGLDSADLAVHTSTWDTPLSTPFRDITVWECPPNGQGLAALLAFALLNGLPPEPDWGSPAALHAVLEALRYGIQDAAAHVADPAFTPPPLDELFAEGRLAPRRAAIRSGLVARALPGLPAAGTDTVYVAVVDAQGNACSLINSNYMGFGSGLVTHETGIALQNRGAGFNLIPGHPNCYGPGKRPFHTIIPGLATRTQDGALRMVFGVMGGPMQPQGHVQVLVNLLDHGLDPQRALDAPRAQLMADGRVALEPGFSLATQRELATRGHRLVPAAQVPGAGQFGGAQLIVLDEAGSRAGASDPRKDGLVAAAPFA
jgi:gamma-glutamyltranspeptidase/glutathione hydrolase